MTRKLTFCFLVYDKINQYDIWVKFFEGVDTNKYDIYIHSKNPKKDLGWFNKFKLKRTISTKWGDVSIVKAQNLLYEEALKNSDNYKFINLSQSCIPVQPFDYIYEYLTKDDMSIINKCPESECFPRCNILLKHLSRENIFKSHQWMILNREHANICAYNESFINLFEKLDCPDEHFNIIRINKRGDISKIKYGATTYTNWAEGKNGSPKTYVNVSDCNIQALRDEGYLFARKF